MNNKLNASEAIFGFCGWLTTRDKRTIMSSKDNPGAICDLIEKFCKVNNLPEVRENFTDYFVMPTEKKIHDEKTI